jgi:hypothetical protein
MAVINQSIFWSSDMPTATKPKTTKPKTTKPKAKAEPKAPKAVTKLDGMVDVTEMIEIWNGMSPHSNKFSAKMNVLQVQAVVLGEYAIYDYCSNSHYKIAPWFEVYKLVTVQDKKIWNRVVSAIRSYSQADDIVQELLRGESAIKIQRRVDADYQCRPMTASGSFNRYGVHGPIPPQARRGSNLYGDRHEWSLNPELIEAEASGTGDW